MIKLDGIHIDGSYYRRIQTRAQSKILKFLSPRTEGLYSLIRAALISMQPVHAHAIYSCRLQLTVAVPTLTPLKWYSASTSTPPTPLQLLLGNVLCRFDMSIEAVINAAGFANPIVHISCLS
jgi:hypothetical protein